MRVMLITGGAGFIGSHFVSYWSQHYPEDQLIILDNLTYAGNLRNLNGLERKANIRFIKGDICDEHLVNEIFSSQSINIVMHFAAESHVDRSILDPDCFIKTNVLGTHALLKAAQRHWEKNSHSFRFHHVSTDEVFGSLRNEDSPCTETSPYNPSSPYSASKAASDHLVKAYSQTYGLPVTLSHCSNNYGPHQYPEKLIPLVTNCVLTGSPVPIYGTGENIRDWLYVEDHCRALDIILSRGSVGETYAIAGNQAVSNIVLVNELCRIMDQQFEENPSLKETFPKARPAQGIPSSTLIKFIKDRPGHDWRYALDDRKIRQQFEFTPAIKLEEGLKKTVDFYASKEFSGKKPPTCASQSVL